MRQLEGEVPEISASTMANDYRKQLDQVAWSLCVLSTLTVCARCYCRAWVLRNFGWDDGFMVLALVCVSGQMKQF